MYLISIHNSIHTCILFKAYNQRRFTKACVTSGIAKKHTKMKHAFGQGTRTGIPVNDNIFTKFADERIATICRPRS